MKIGELINGDVLERTFADKAETYRARFSDIINSSGVSELECDSEEVGKKVAAKVKWNWAGFLFGSLWAVYRNLPEGWFFLAIILFGSVLELFVPSFAIISNKLGLVAAIVFGLFGNTFLLKAFVGAHTNNDKDPVETLRPSWLRVVLTLVALFVFYIFWGFFTA